jgi:tetratricopeptide (TPR) repeat protein
MRAAIRVLSLSLFLAVSAASAGTSPLPSPRRSASELMKRGLYRDAARTLLQAIAGRPEAECGRQFRMLGECLYQSQEYAKARPWFAKALAHAAEARGRTIAEYRLACVAYRLGDRAEAQERIDRFVRTHPSDHRCGTLLLFRMKLLAREGAQAEADLEAVHKLIHDRRKTFGSAAVMTADKLLTDFYLAHGREDKARQRYASMVHNFRNVIAQYARDKRPVPDALRQAHDEAAMQLGIISLRTQRHDEAVKWLENVKYDAELLRKARLALAQVAYQRRDYDRAIRHLTRNGFLDTVPPGLLRSDMCLVLGLCYPRERACLAAARCCIELREWEKAKTLLQRTTRDFPTGNRKTIDEAKRLVPEVLKQVANQR